MPNPPTHLPTLHKHRDDFSSSSCEHASQASPHAAFPPSNKSANITIILSLILFAFLTLMLLA